jgi:hypothetical protein
MDTNLPVRPAFWRSAFSEADGTGSASRVLSAIVLINALILVDAVAWHIKGIPDLGAVSTFVSSSIGVLYGVNKVFTKVSDIFGNKSGGTN